MSRDDGILHSKLVSAGAIMREFYASGLVALVRVTAKWGEPGQEGEKLAEDYKADVHKHFSSWRQDLSDIGLAGVRASLDKILEHAKSPDCTWGDLKETSNELVGRIIDEAKDKVFFSMTLRESDYYTIPRKGWEATIARFPQVIDDVEESSKCLALSRYAAAVFHSLQIVEHTLIELGKFIKVKDPHSGWSAVSKTLDLIIKKPHKDRSRFEKKNIVFLEQMHGTIEGLKNAWRNKISHAQGKLTVMTKEFSPEVAEEIFFATRAFTRRLAEGIPPPKAKASS